MLQHQYSFFFNLKVFQENLQKYIPSVVILSRNAKQKEIKHWKQWSVLNRCECCVCSYTFEALFGTAQKNNVACTLCLPFPPSL